MSNEIKAVATLDDKLSPGLSNIEKSIQKFSFSTDGMLSKLARSFSATDIAVGVLVGSVAALVKSFDKANAAYLASENAAKDVVDRFKTIDKQIKENDASIGESTIGWKLYFKEIELGASKAVAAWFKFDSAVKKAGSASRRGDFTRPGKAAWEQNDPMEMGPPFRPGVTNADIDVEDTVAYATYRRNAADEAEREASAQAKIAALRTQSMNRGQVARINQMFRGFSRGKFNEDAFNPTDPYGTNKSAFQAPGDGSRDSEFGAFSSFDKMSDKLSKEAITAQRAVDTLANGLRSAFSGMLFDGMKLSEGLKGIFRSMVEDILAQLSAKAATSIIGVLIPGFGMRSAGVQVDTAAVRTNSAAMAYERARGR